MESQASAVDRFGQFPGGRRGWWIAVAAVILAVAVRGRAVQYGDSFEGYPDEPLVVDPALAAARGDLRPRSFAYPGWTAYTIGAVYKALDVGGVGGEEGFLPAEPTARHFVVARAVVFAVSLVTIAVTALLGRRLAGAWAGFAAACLLCASPTFTGMSFLVTVNPPASLWTAASVLFAARVYSDGRRPRDYVASAVCAGLAIGCKYNSYPAALALVAAHFLAPRAADGMRHRWLLASGSLVPIAFFLTTPYALIEFPRFREGIRYLSGLYDDPDWPLHSAASGTSYGAYLERFWTSGWPREMSVVAIAGAVALTLRDWRKSVILALPALVNYAFLGLYPVFFLRHLLPALPVLAVFSGAAVHGAADRIGRSTATALRQRTVAAVSLLAIAGAGFRGFRAAEERVSRKDPVDSRQAALEWVLANVPDGARILREAYTPPIERQTDRYHVRAVRSIAVPDRTSEVGEFDFALITMQDDRIIGRDPSYAAARAIYDAFAARHDLVAHLRGRGEQYSGRDIRIYAIRTRQPGDASR